MKKEPWFCRENHGSPLKVILKIFYIKWEQFSTAPPFKPPTIECYLASCDMTHKPVLSLPTLTHCYLLLVYNHLYRYHYTHSVLMTKNGDITGTIWYWTGFMGSVVQTGPILKCSSSCGWVKKISNIKLYYTHFCTLTIKQMEGMPILTMTLVWFRVAGGGDVA